MTITKEGTLASFYTVNKAPIKHLRVYFSPKQAGSGDPSPTNVRSIDGWTGLSVIHCGKNMLHVSNSGRTASGLTYTFNCNTSGEVTSVNVDGTGTQPNGNYFTNLNYAGTEANIIPADQIISGGSPIANIVMNGRIQYMSDVTANEYYIDEATAISRNLIGRAYRIQLVPYPYLDANNNEIHTVVYPMVRHANDTDPTFEPYSGTTIPIDWSSEAGALYGGYVDLISGELVKTHTIKSITGDEDWYMSNGISGACAYRPTLNVTTAFKSGYIEPVCNKLKGVAKWATAINECTINENGNFYFGAPEELSTKEAVNNWIKSIGGFEIVYPISPITYQLSPTQLSTFLGRNNIWSNADRVEVEYDLAGSNDELYRRRNILLRSVPHIETASGNIAHFETNIAAPIQSAKISFSPIQEGSGTPSPTNIRPISGWTNLSLYHSGENLYVPNSNNKGYISKSGVITVDETSTYTDLIPVNLGDVYSFECTTVSVNGDTNRRIHGYNNSGTWVKQLTSGTTAANTVEYRKISATIPAGISYIRISFRNQDTNVRITKENIVEANWQTAAGTIYGGYIDLINGKLIETKQKKTYDGSSDEIWWTYSSGNYSGFGINQKDMFSGIRSQGKSNWLNIASTASSNKYECWLGVNNTYIYIVGISNLLESITVENWRAYLAEHPLEIVYPLATLIEHSLTPQSLKTLKGTNNIWSNANGPVEIKYWTH